MKILILSDNSGPKYFRVLLPVFLMPGVEFVTRQRLSEEDLQGVDILFFNRVISNTSINKVLEWREKYGFKLIVDFDDHWTLGPDHLLFDMYQHFQLSEIMAEYVKLADCVTVTHERLQKEVLPLNKNVHVLENSIPKFGQFLYKKTPSEKSRLFWAGGITHKKDLFLLSGPSKRINRPGVQWVIGGFVEKNPEWTAMANTFTNGGRFDHQVLGSLPVDSYYACYSECDISLIPLINSTFNSFKSNLKILEAANISAPVVVSRVQPYLDFPEDLVNYVTYQSDWYTQVDKLLRDPKLAKEQGIELMHYCDREYNFEKINEKRRQVFYDTTNTTANRNRAGVSESQSV